MFNSKAPVTIEPPAPAMPVSGLPGGPGGYGESEVHLLDRLSVIYRYRHIVAAVTVIVVIGGMVQTYTTTKEYQATAVVQIDPERSAIQGIAQSLFPEDEGTAQQTEITKLAGRALALRVARKLDLANNSEFNGQDGHQPTGLGDAMSSLQVRLTAPIKALFRGKTPPPAVVTAAQKDEIKEAALAALAKGESPETTEEAPRVSLLLSKLTVTPQLGSRLVNITITSFHPEFAAKAANAWVDEYVASSLEFKTNYLRVKQTKLQEQIKRMQDNLVGAQKMFRDGARNTPQGGYIDQAALSSVVATSRGEWTRSSIATTTAKAEYERLARVKLDDPASVVTAATTIPGLSTDNTAQGYVRDIDDKLKEIARLKKGQAYSDQHPSILALNSEVDSYRALLKQRLSALVDSARLLYEQASNTEERYKGIFQDQEKMANDQAQAGVSLEMLQNTIKSRQELLDKLTQQSEEAGVEAAATSNNVRKADYAQVPSAPFRPDPARNMLMALIAGAVIALGLAFGLDYLDDTVKTPEDITKKLHVPFLGLVPAVRGDKQPVLSGPVPHDFGESYRALRTSLVFTSGGESTRVITVTSAQPLEGKTTTACNLAMVLAFGGSRVLLMDADMRRPGVHKALKINNTVGLSHLLVGQARVREAIQRTSDPNFCVMTAGRTPPNPSELLSSERMRQLIANLKQGPFDWVVIDTPPVLAVTDAVILTPLVDGVTFVVGAEMTRRRLAERAVHMIMASRPKVVGAVLNRVNFDRNKYYYSRYYGYQYKSYYGTHTSNTTPGPKA